MIPRIAAAILGGYFLGALPVGLWFGILMRGVDVRASGSGKTGATNVLRTLGPIPAALVVSLDFTKGAVAATLGWHLLGTSMLGAIAGILAVAGHCWPALGGFRGGRGVATAMGALAALSVAAFVSALVVFVVVLAVTRYVSLGSIAAVLLAPLSVLRFRSVSAAPDAAEVMAVLAAALVLANHADNLGRLRRGTERRLSR
ncbi:MAG: glycerol-3-phosphate 1-O-acyltransferase PlsY [Candidatus Dormibacteria bacterium]